MRSAAIELVRNLAAKLNLGEVCLDADGYCCVAFDDIVVNLEHEEDRDEFLLFCKVAAAPGDASPRYLEELLDLSYAAMLSAGGCLGLDRASAGVMFADRFALRAIDDAAFEKAIEDYVDRAEGWMKLLSSSEFARLTREGPKLEDVGSMMRI